MGKSKNPPPTESLVYKSWLAHGAVRVAPARRGRDYMWGLPDARFAFFPADQYGPVDTVCGADSMFIVRIDIPYRKRGSNEDLYFEHWEWTPIQIKGGKKCTFTIMPLPNPIPDFLEKRIGARLIRKARAHYARHRTINNILFVPPSIVDANDPMAEKVLLDEVWRATMNLVNTRFELIGLKYRIK